MRSIWGITSTGTAFGSQAPQRAGRIIATALYIALSTGAAFAQQAAPATVEPAAPTTTAPVAPANQPAAATPADASNAATGSGTPAAEPTQPGGNVAAQPGAVASEPAATGAAPSAASTPIDTTVGAPAGTDVPKSLLPHDLSPWGMFMAADWVVKGVMIGLAFASLITWTVWLAKSLEIAASKARLKKALRGILHARRLADASQALGDRAGIGSVLVRAAVEEFEMSGHEFGQGDASGIKERVESRLMRIQAQAGRRLSRGTGVLATIGSTAPFVGLFGTVWGIMNSFIGISESQTTNLAVVAPGIAEALLATAVGLIAAIPAVVIYNVFARSITGYRQGLADAAAGVQRLVSRDLDRQTQRAERSQPANEALRGNGRIAPAVAV
ncbi:tonB-system energizer ExbB [Aminobacter anthyllidis]|uniref:Biopolymer transport protein ExbB n=1 Tax=Aminobacter anthyllidis TaxID=1035067 RepID=A0A9X1D5U6_9HYPH|nr:tonB-system energizer ExbB [Aminobacter anthyllidis]MBT1158205.1 tonB-system energizer ExbB [Aminobacter anthyllidis]MDH4986533.1 tonB-system energizer ExbB [Aminobacter anthyllidis]